MYKRQGYGHGLAIPEHINIPFIVSGKNARQEFLIKPRQIDVAPTVFAHLGLDVPDSIDWDGVPVGLQSIDSHEAAAESARLKPKFLNEEHFGVGGIDVSIDAPGQVRYTLDGTLPTALDPVYDGKLNLKESATVKARSFRGGVAVGPSSSAKFEVQKSELLGFKPSGEIRRGVLYAVFDAELTELPKQMIKTVAFTGISDRISLLVTEKEENFGIYFEALFLAPEDGIYEFRLTSDDGSHLKIGDEMVVDHDGAHGATAKHGFVALTKGHHEFFVAYFQGGGAMALRLEFRLKGESEFTEVTADQLSYELTSG